MTPIPCLSCGSKRHAGLQSNGRTNYIASFSSPIFAPLLKQWTFVLSPFVARGPLSTERHEDLKANVIFLLVCLPVFLPWIFF
ncbi:uncharacterized protein K444DRAFT_609160 [Hyaloscypha bicolor E]|uniref:Uncharacterized protein n=1 Tax=Hyaloscypha bicolor E TaxID=1095630 RepID=A0A2J6TME8_9HELO|nr:uncharacterized protein K444DRAFT_609160 [Hyaloscypha bicolor E]PMD64191.1 hypothetical protein K444DRAFT_609160 [Hyaloscypha bicolor E]